MLQAMTYGQVAGNQSTLQSSEQRVLILGAGSFAGEVADLIREIPGFVVEAFVESLDRSKAGDQLEGLPILWIDDIRRLTANHVGVCALGTTKRSTFIEQTRAMGLRFVSMAHPSAQISAASALGCGTLVSRGAIIAAHTKVGQHVVINRGCLIGHHVEIGAFCTISPGANVAGNARIGTAVYVGMGAIILNGIRVGDHSIVGAGSVVTKDVPDHVEVVGVPAKITKEDIEGL